MYWHKIFYSTYTDKKTYQAANFHNYSIIDKCSSKDILFKNILYCDNILLKFYNIFFFLK